MPIDGCAMSQVKSVSAQTFDELSELSPTIARIRSDLGSAFDAEMAKVHPSEIRRGGWSGGLRPNRKAATTRRSSQAQTHLALTLQMQQDEDER